MRRYVSRLWKARRSSVDKKAGGDRQSVDTSNQDALETIARRVWGLGGPDRLKAQPDALGDLLREIERRIPQAVEGKGATSATIRRALRSDTPYRFRAYLSPGLPSVLGERCAEVGVYVEGRNVRFTALGSKEEAGFSASCEVAAAAWSELVDELRPFRRIEARDDGIDEQGRPFLWVRFEGLSGR